MNVSISSGLASDDNGSDKALDSNGRISRGDGNDQQRLADSLQRTLGSAAAISACQALGWDGVIRYLLGRDTHPA